MPSQTNDYRQIMADEWNGTSPSLRKPPFLRSRFAYHQLLRVFPFVVRFLSVVVFFSALFTAASSENSRSGWPQFRGSPALTGTVDIELPKPLRLRWSFEAKDSIESSAAILDGVVYVGSMDSSLYALDLATGKLRWRYVAGGQVQESSPCVHGGTVFVGDLDGILHAVEAATGKGRWTFKAEAEIKSSPNCTGNRVYFGSYDQNLYCLSSETGALIWKYATEGPVHCTPAIDNGLVYVSGCDETLRAIDASSGKQISAVSLGAYSGASAAVHDRHAYVGTFGNEVLGIDLRAGAIQWVYKHPSRSFPFYSSAAVTATRVVLGGRDKVVHCLDRSTGKAVWTYTTRARIDSSPLITANRVFVGSSDGLLYELDLETGKKNWEFTAGAPLSASPAAAGGFLVIGSQDGILYCFGS
jgi:outer membrane protein assembly factor BamB